MKTVAAFLLIALALLLGCGKRETRVSDGNRRQILHRGNGSEPQDLDPHVVAGVPEDDIITALLEGLTSEDPVDLHPVPGVAEKWDILDDGKRYVFHFRADAKWSDGQPVVASDFVEWYKRILTPALASEYAYMLYVAKNAEAFNKGTLTNFNEVGFKAIDDRTLEVQLNGPTPYFLSLLTHYSWFPVPIKVIARHGSLYERGNRWTLPQNFVGNGPFVLSEWKINTVVAVKKSPTYWDAKTVKLNEIRFYPIESYDTEERSFRSGQLHVTYQLPISKIDAYRQSHSEMLRIDPYLGTYFFRLNVTKPILKDKRVRQALSLSVDREAITRSVTRAGEAPAYELTPPNTAGYTSTTKLTMDVPKARQLLADAGFPNGAGFPEMELVYNTHENNKAIAEAVQEMWNKNLNIHIRLVNQEWKVYIETERMLNYQIGRFAWIGDYVDPNSFLDMFLSGGGNNQTGWSNAEYDRLIHEAGLTGDKEKRFALFNQAEAILLEELPIIPIYHWVQPYLLSPSVHGWNPTLINHHPYKYVYLKP